MLPGFICDIRVYPRPITCKAKRKRDTDLQSTQILPGLICDIRVYLRPYYQEK